MKAILTTSMIRLLALAAVAVLLAGLLGTGSGSSRRNHPASERKAPAARHCAQLVRSTHLALRSDSTCSPSKSVWV